MIVGGDVNLNLYYREAREETARPNPLVEFFLVFLKILIWWMLSLVRLYLLGEIIGEEGL